MLKSKLKTKMLGKISFNKKTKSWIKKISII